MSNSEATNGPDEALVWHLVRHGQTEWNRSGRILGQTDIPLNQSGMHQITQLGERLATSEFSAIYASDLSRTSESAHIIRGSRNVLVQAESELREFSYGDWEGLTFEAAQARDPEGFATRMAGRNLDFAAPGGENMLQLIDRVRRFHDRVRSLHQPGDQLLVVAHGGTLLALLNCLLGLPAERVWSFRLDVASLSIVKTYAGVGVLELWNDTSHHTRQTRGDT